MYGYIYIHTTYIYICMYIHVYIYMCVYLHIYICLEVLGQGKDIMRNLKKLSRFVKSHIKVIFVMLFCGMVKVCDFFSFKFY